MKFAILSFLALALALASPAAAGDFSPAERAALAGQPATDVAALRAGASADVPALALAERTELTRAAASATDLDALRAGDHDDVSVAVVVLGVVLLAIIIF